MSPRIEWASLTQAELEQILTAGRAEGARRVRSLLSLMGVSGGGDAKRGRKPADPFAGVLSELTGEDGEDPEEGAAADSVEN